MNVFTEAWKIAKEAVVKFGGKASEFFAEALRMAWAIKKGGRMIATDRFTGTPAQKEYARDIIIGGVNYCKDVIARYESKDQSKPKVARVLSFEKSRLEKIMSMVDGGKKINSKKIIESSRKVECAYNKQFIISF